MTKEQFIKRVEEITGYELSWVSTDNNNRYKFCFKSKWDSNLRLIIKLMDVEHYYYRERVKYMLQSVPLENSWLLPLGEAIKEYYETN